MSLSDLSVEQRAALADEQQRAYDDLRAKGLKLDLTRGKPSAHQLDLSLALLSLPGEDYTDADGVDTRNYGGLEGLRGLREIFSELLHIPVDQLLAGDNSSLTIMHELVTFAMLFGVPGGDGPWFGKGVKFICPVPGYDRHFSICEDMGIEMIPVDLTERGPDLDQVRELLTDPLVRGMWVVPMYANPSGVIYDEATTAALLTMEAAAPDFRIWWDNAYGLHHLTDNEREPIDVLSIAAEVGHPDRVFCLASTSKVTFAGAGVSFFGSSPDNIAWYKKHLAIRSIGPDKVNQLRHLRYFENAEGVRSLMRRHRSIMAPKFDAVLRILDEMLSPFGVATWTHPEGGYFITLDVVDGTATRVVELAKEAGIALTPAGASHPYGRDPHDRTIRLAPSMPTEADVETAMAGVATCVLLAALEKAGSTAPA